MAIIVPTVLPSCTKELEQEAILESFIKDTSLQLLGREAAAWVQCLASEMAYACTPPEILRGLVLIDTASRWVSVGAIGSATVHHNMLSWVSWVPWVQHGMTLLGRSLHSVPPAFAVWGP